MRKNKTIIITGPHGSEKTALALELAEMMGKPYQILPRYNPILIGTMIKTVVVESWEPADLDKLEGHQGPRLILCTYKKVPPVNQESTLVICLAKRG